MTIEIVISFITGIVTYISGLLAKKYKLVESELIPLQNIAIGVLAGVIVYLLGLNSNLITSIFICSVSAMGAGGTYDLAKTKINNNGGVNDD